MLNWALGQLGLGSLNIGYSNWAMWIVFSYIWLPFMILPIWSAIERVPDSLHRGLGRPRSARLADVPLGAVPADPARASPPARSSRSR